MKRVFLLVIMVSVMVTAAYAEGEMEAYGEVLEVDAASGALTIMEYDYKEDKDIKRSYTVTDKSSLVNIKKLSDLKKDNWVGIFYKIEQGVPLAQTVLLDVPFEIVKEEEKEEKAPKKEPALKRQQWTEKVPEPTEKQAEEKPQEAQPAAEEAGLKEQPEQIDMEPLQEEIDMDALLEAEDFNLDDETLDLDSDLDF